MKLIRSLLQSLTCLGILDITASVSATTTTIETAQSGDVRAELSYSYQENENRLRRFSNVGLKIVRTGKPLLDQPLPTESEYDWPLVKNSSEHFQARDLDQDQEPEIIADFFTSGAH